MSFQKQQRQTYLLRVCSSAEGPSTAKADGAKSLRDLKMVLKCLPIMGGMEHMEVFFFFFQLGLWFVWKSSKRTELCRSKLHPDTVSVAYCCVYVRSQIESLSLHYFLLGSSLQTKLKALGVFFFVTRILGKTHSWTLWTGEILIFAFMHDREKLL